MAGALRALVRPSREEFLKINIRVRDGEGAAKQKKKERKNIFDIPSAPALPPPSPSSLDASIPAFLSFLFLFFHYPSAKRIARNLSLSLSVCYVLALS